MTRPSHTRVLFFVSNENPDPDLSRIALRHGWPLLQFLRALQAFEDIRRCLPGVVLVQVSLRLGEDLELIRLVRTELVQVSLIAVASPHHDEIERAVRSAGASCYLPGATDVPLAERTVAEMLDRQKNVPRSAMKPTGTLLRPRQFSSFFPPPAEYGRRA